MDKNDPANRVKRLEAKVSADEQQAKLQQRTEAAQEQPRPKTEAPTEAKSQPRAKFAEPAEVQVANLKRSSESTHQEQPPRPKFAAAAEVQQQRLNDRANSPPPSSEPDRPKSRVEQPTPLRQEFETEDPPKQRLRNPGDLLTALEEGSAVPAPRMADVPVGGLDTKTVNDELTNLRRYCDDLDSRLDGLDQRYEPKRDDILDFGSSAAEETTVSPFAEGGVNGVAWTVTGSYSAATPYLWFNIATNTAEWKAGTMSPWPDDTMIRNGALAGQSPDWWVER